MEKSQLVSCDRMLQMHSSLEKKHRKRTRKIMVPLLRRAQWTKESFPASHTNLKQMNIFPLGGAGVAESREQHFANRA